jgi:hypothetical protein
VTDEIFIGYKKAAEIFEQYELYNNCQSMGYQTNVAIREAFINSCFFVKEEKENNRLAHTLWQPLQDGDNSYCGIKIRLIMFKDSPNKRVHFSFPFRIPFTNILPLQAIDQYCQDVFGIMHFEAYSNPKGMV